VNRGVRRLWWLWLLPVLVGVWFFRTWFHTPLMLLYTRPAILEGLIVALLVGGLLLPRWSWLTRRRAMSVTVNTLRGSERRQYHHRLLPWAVGLVGVIIVAAFAVVGGWGRATYLATHLDYRCVEALPDSTEGIRLMPYTVAHRYAKDSLQLSQYRLGTENMVLDDDDRLAWVFPLTPDGLVITFTKQNKGLVLVDATTQDKNCDTIWQDLAIGEGMQLTDNLWWRIYRHRYFVTTEDPFYLTSGRDIHTCVPAVSYDFAWRWGVVHTVPRFAGLFLVDAAGEVVFLTPDEARQHSVTAGNRLFPELLAREYVNAYQFHLGVANKLFVHEDQLQIQDVRSVTHINRQPFLIQTEAGPMWFVGTEPFGESHGIFKIFLVDAVSGEINLYELPQAENLTGPIRAADYVRRANPIVDWSRFELVEPLPFIRDGALYWKLAVVPGDAAGIAYQAFVDSRSNEVIEAHTAEQVKAFLRGDLSPVGAGSDTLGGDESVDEVIDAIQARLEEIGRLLEQLRPSADRPAP